MDAGLARVVLMVAFVGHGVIMLMAATTIGAGREASAGFGESWLLPGGIVGRIAGFAVWGTGGVGFLVAAWALYMFAPWWTGAVLLGGLGTLAAIALWFRAVPSGVYGGGAMALAAMVWVIVAQP